MKKHYLIISILPLLTYACFKTKSDIRQEQEINQIESRMQKVETLKADTQMSMSELQTELWSLKGKIEEVDHKKNTDSDITLKIEELIKQVAEVNVHSKELDLRLDTLEAKLISFEKSSNTSKNAHHLTKVNEDSEEVKGDEEEKNTTPKKEAPLKSEKKSTDSYQDGLKLLKNNDYDKAEKSFKLCVKESKNKNIEECYFWLGEIYFSQENYTESANHFKVVIEKYTKSRRVPEAMLKVGMCFENLGLKKEARVFYEELSSVYPKSSQGLKAKAKMHQMKK